MACMNQQQYSSQEALLIKVDVIIAVHNAESTIEETVRSAMHQIVPDHLMDRLLWWGSNNSHYAMQHNDDIVCGDMSMIDKDGQRAKQHYPRNIHFDICVCCYNDASTDRSFDILESLNKEHTWHPRSNENSNDCAKRISMQMKLLLGTAPPYTSSRGAGYARNQAVKLRDKCEHDQKPKGGDDSSKQVPTSEHFLCILDSDDIMHPTRIAEQTCAMLSLEKEIRGKTLMGCQFDRIPKDSTHHYTQWANSLSDERLYLEQFRECTLIQPTWFLSKAWFEHLGGWVNAPAFSTSSNNNEHQQKRVRLDPRCDKFMKVESKDEHDTNAIKSTDSEREQYYQLIHPTELVDSTTNSKGTKKSDKRKIDPIEPKSVHTLRLAEDSRLFYAHLHAKGKLHLHRTPIPLVTYRHRSGMSQSSSTPRKLLLKLRAKAWEHIVFYGNNSGSSTWASSGFAIWGAGRDGKDFLKSLSPSVQSKVLCFVDVDEKKIEQIKFYDNPRMGGGRRIPILHFSVLAKNKISEQSTFGRINKKHGEHDFDVLKQHEQTLDGKKTEDFPKAKQGGKKKKKNQLESIDPQVLQQLPVVVCVAMYRTNGALESNVASIGRTEGKDLWHII